MIAETDWNNQSKYYALFGNRLPATIMRFIRASTTSVAWQLSLLLHHQTSAFTPTSKPHHAPSSLHMQIIEADVAIVGGGPAGCTCALYTSRADLSTVILDKNPSSGALAITSHIANYPGVDRTYSGAELLDQMRLQAVRYGTRYERAQVFMMDVSSDETGDEFYSKCVYTPDFTVKARALVLAAGAMGRVGNPIPGEKEFLGRGVSYCATCDGAFYRDAEVVVYGASTEAIEEALYLTKFASTVYWITPTDISKETVSGLERNKVLNQDLLKNLLLKANVWHLEKTKITEVVGDVSGVTGVKIKSPGKEEEILTVEGAFIYGAGGGSKPITDFCQSKVDLDQSGGVIVDRHMKTSRDGVYAIGDIRNTQHKQVVVAASEGFIAAESILKYLGYGSYRQIMAEKGDVNIRTALTMLEDVEAPSDFAVAELPSEETQESYLAFDVRLNNIERRLDYLEETVDNMPDQVLSRMEEWSTAQENGWKQQYKSLNMEFGRR